MIAMDTKQATIYLTVVAVVLIQTSNACPPECNGCSGGQVDCLQAGLRDIPKSFSDDTVVIDLTGNQITELSRQSFPALESVQSVRMSSNGVTSIEDNALESIPNLMSLELSSNSISIIHNKAFSGMTKLRTVTLTHNNLRMIGDAFKDLTSLSSLYLAFNQLTEISEDDFEGNPNLRMLELSNNRITSIHSNAFKHLTMLRYLILNNNPIVMANDLQFSSQVLQLVDFTKCQLKEVPKKLPASVADLRLGNNEITGIQDQDFEGMTNLMLLTLNDNMLKNITYRSLKGLKNLKELWLSHNELFYIPQGIPQNLEKLFMDNNQVYDIYSNAFPPNSSLKVISLEMNDIAMIAPESFHGLDHLEELNIQGNKFQEIKSMTFKDLPALSLLQISNNPVSKIEPGAFENLPSLKSLAMSHVKAADTKLTGDFLTAISNVEHIQLLDSPDLAKNFLMYLRKSRSLTMPGVKVLDLEYNDLKTIPQKVRSVLVNIERMFLDGNAFHCDKRLIWLKRWMEEEIVTFFNGEPPACASPYDIQGQEIKTMAESRFVDFVPEPQNSVRTPPTDIVLVKQDRSQSAGTEAQEAANQNPVAIPTQPSQPVGTTRVPRRKKGKGKRKTKGKRRGRKRKRNKKKGKKRGKKNKRRGKRQHRANRLKRKMLNRKRRCIKLPDGTLRCRRKRPKVKQPTQQPSVIPPTS